MAAIPPAYIPSNLWDNETLRLPEAVTAAYKAVLSANSLTIPLDAGEAIFGGVTKEESEKHFRYRFCVSAGRGAYTLLDPKETLRDAASYLQTSLADGRVGVLDLACGAGAATAGLLCTLASVRDEGVFPRLPLNLDILGADIAVTARGLCDSIHGHLERTIRTSGIAVTRATHEWDMMDVASTSDLCDHWLARNLHAEELLIVISGMSGALRSAEQRAAANNALTHILTRVHSRPHTLLWIEPDMKGVANGLFRWLRGLLRPLRWLRAGDGTVSASATYMLDDGCRPPYRSNIAVERVARAAE